MPIVPASSIDPFGYVDKYEGTGGDDGGGGSDESESACMFCRTRSSSSGGRGSGFAACSNDELPAALVSPLPYGAARPPNSCASFGGSGSAWVGGGCSGGMFATMRERPARDRRELDVELDDDAGLDGRSRSNDVVDGGGV